MSSDKSSIIDKAQKLAAKGQITQAIAEWQRLIAETPNDGNIYNTIGDLHLKANQKSEATNAYLKAADAFKVAGFELKSIAVYKKIIKVDPSQMEVYEKLADVHAERGLTGNAVEDYLKVAKHYVKQGDMLSALSVYRKLANLDPKNSGVRLKIAEMCQKQGLEKEAVEEYGKVLDIYESKSMFSESKALLEQILKIDPAYIRGKEFASPEPPSIAEASLPSEPMTQEPMAVEPAAEEQIILEPMIPEPPLMEEIRPATDEPVIASPPSLSERMEQTLAEGDWGAAERILGELTESPIDLFGFLSKWFNYYLKESSLPKAFFILQKAVHVADENAFFGESRALIEQYINESPRQVSVHQLLAENFEKSGKLDEAMECHSKVISLLSEQKSESEAKAYYEKLKLSLPAIGAVKRWKELFEPEPVDIAPEANISANEDTSIAQEVFEIAIEEEKVPASFALEEHSEEADIPDQISEATFKGHLTEADVYLKYGLYSKAIEQLLLVSELCPSREEPHVQLKEIYLKQGMTEKAVRECWVLARFYGKRGADDKKREVLQELKLLDPDNQYKKEEGVPARKESPAASAQAGNDHIGQVEWSEGLENLAHDGIADTDNKPDTENDDNSDDLKIKMDRVDEYLEQGNRDAAKSLLWKILDKYSNCAEARLKLLKIQERPKTEERPAARAAAPSTVDLSAEGMDEASFEGLSEALERSFSGLMSKGDEPSSENLDDADAPSVSLEKSVPNEEYVDLTSIFSEELEEEDDMESSLAGLEDTVLDDAFKDFQKGIQASVDKQDFETHYDLGIAYKEMGLLPEAIKEFELAFQGDLRFQDASMMLASCYREKGTTNAAIDVLTNALSDPRCKREHVLAIKYELATIYDSEGNKNKAKVLYEEVSRLDPTFRDVTNKNTASESEPLVKSVPSGRDQREETAPKRDPATKKKNKISYL